MGKGAEVPETGQGLQGGVTMRGSAVDDKTPPAVHLGRHHWTYGVVLGLGFIGLTATGPIYNTYVPLLLHNAGLSAALVAFVMTWNNWLALFIPAWAGSRSDHTWTWLGRRRPWILAGAPVGVVAFALIPVMPALAGLLGVILINNAAQGLIRAPGLALLGDQFDPGERSKASGVINLMGGLGAVVALVGSSYVYKIGPSWPFWLGAGLMLASSLVLIIAVREHREWGTPSTTRESAWGRLRAMLKGADRPAARLLLATFCAFSAYSILEKWVSSFAHLSLGLDAGRVPLILAVFAGFLLVGAIPAGFLGAAIGQRRTMGIGIAILTVLFSAGLFVTTPTALILLLVPAGIAWALVISNIFPLLYAVAGDGSMGLFTGLYYTVSSLAAIIGPQAVGLLLDATGQNYRVMWLLAAVLMGIGGVLAAGKKE